MTYYAVDAIRDLALQIDHAFTSPNVSDSQGETANLVDTTSDIARALYSVASALRDIAAALSDKGEAA